MSYTEHIVCAIILLFLLVSAAKFIVFKKRVIYCYGFRFSSFNRHTGSYSLVAGFRRKKCVFCCQELAVQTVEREM
jgi:hypothetical protein